MSSTILGELKSVVHPRHLTLPPLFKRFIVRFILNTTPQNTRESQYLKYKDSDDETLSKGWWI